MQEPETGGHIVATVEMRESVSECVLLACLGSA